MQEPRQIHHGEQALRWWLGTVRVRTIVPGCESRVAVIRNRERCPGWRFWGWETEGTSSQLCQAETTIEITVCWFLKIHHCKLILSEPPQHLAFFSRTLLAKRLKTLSRKQKSHLPFPWIINQSLHKHLLITGWSGRNCAEIFLQNLFL